ncbi:MAG TPA: ABC transporter permease, partial [Thermoplasmata archaeon]|nr:ABC transporter permease [Thermoplasmata archaeon]
RQLSLTPLTRGEWLAATFLWFVTLAFLSAILLVLVGRAAFGAHVTLPALALPFLIVGPTMFVSLGLLAGSASDSPEAAAVLGNIITFPMMFLSGTFFPVNEFPAWLQPVAHALPLYYVIDGLNASMVFNDPAAAYADIAIVAVVTVVLFVVATRVFNWRED